MGVRDYHKMVLNDVEVNRHKLLPPPIVTPNKNKVQKALLTSYHTSDEEGNPYAALKVKMESSTQ